MKKLISIIAAGIVCLMLTACNSENNSSNGDKFAGLELISVEADRITFSDLDALEKACDIAVVGYFTDEPKQEVSYVQFADGGKGVNNIMATCPIKITEVLKGSVEAGDSVNVLQNSGVVNDQLLVFDELTPIQKGDEWMFFLSRSEEHDGYWICGCADGRYPTKNSTARNSKMSLSDSWQLGVVDRANFNEKIYNEIVEKYDV